ncbi:MAG: hypothetical protein IPG07_11855 [Crocinitomicaceae bacterium]|nr:hypothetical protein [Crocinitomicaceae bacterium]
MKTSSDVAVVGIALGPKSHSKVVPIGGYCPCPSKSKLFPKMHCGVGKGNSG